MYFLYGGHNATYQHFEIVGTIYFVGDFHTFIYTMGYLPQKHKATMIEICISLLLR